MHGALLQASAFYCMQSRLHIQKVCCPVWGCILQLQEFVVQKKNWVNQNIYAPLVKCQLSAGVNVKLSDCRKGLQTDDSWCKSATRASTFIFLALFLTWPWRCSGTDENKHAAGEALQPRRTPAEGASSHVNCGASLKAAQKFQSKRKAVPHLQLFVHLGSYGKATWTVFFPVGGVKAVEKRVLSFPGPANRCCALPEQLMRTQRFAGNKWGGEKWPAGLHIRTSARS